VVVVVVVLLLVVELPLVVVAQLLRMDCAGGADAAAPEQTTDAAGAEVLHGGSGGGEALGSDTTGGPAFPTLGVTLDFLERFVEQHVQGKPSRYCTARVDCQASNDDVSTPDCGAPRRRRRRRRRSCHGAFTEPAALGPQELSFKAGEILAISDLDAANDGWLTGYRRAGNWADRKKFRVDAIDRLAGLSTDEVCSDIIKPACSAAIWPEHEQERSYARLALAAGEPGVGTATVFASHAWTFVFAELVASLRFFEAQHVAAGGPPSLFWLDIFVVVRLSHTTIDRWTAAQALCANSRRISLIMRAGRERGAHLPQRVVANELHARCGIDWHNCTGAHAVE
jgi:hypothetical protein